VTLPPELARHLPTPSPFDVHWMASTTSTMDAAGRLAGAGAAHATVVVADEQTAGRGRRGNRWSSPPGAGLYLSFIARPAASRLSLLTLAAGVAVRDAIAAASGLAVDLKWPNDVIAGRRKLAGILAEGFAVGTPDQAVVIGIGVNVQPAAYPPEVSQRATSLERELGRSVDRGAVFAAILERLNARIAQLDDSPGDILRAWREASPSAIGTRVEWDSGHGLTAGIADDGALLVETASGIERFIAGELVWHFR